MIPKKCVEANIFIAKNTAPTCPANYAAYMAEDWDYPMLGCCPLPAKNILSKDPAVVRQVCTANEIATGVQGRGLLCTRINTSLYKLAPAKKTCYVGKGDSGGKGSKACSAPPETLSAMAKKSSSDACLGVPYGSLIVGRTGDDCKDVSSAELLDAITGKPIKMFE